MSSLLCVEISVNECSFEVFFLFVLWSFFASHFHLKTKMKLYAMDEFLYSQKLPLKKQKKCFVDLKRKYLLLVVINVQFAGTILVCNVSSVVVVFCQD